MTKTIRPEMTTLHRNEQGERWCAGLAGIPGHYAPENAFTAYPRNLDGLQNACRACHTAAARFYRYGVTPEAYEAAKEIQGGCYICHTDGALFVDHDHTTNRIRGLLCGRCNVALGWLDDSIAKASNLFYEIFMEEHEDAPECECLDEEPICQRCRQGSSRLYRDPYRLSRVIRYLDGENEEAVKALRGGRA